MKKIIYGIIILILMFAIDVQAKEMGAASIPNGTYLIGKHEFTRDKTDNYNGTLTVQHIMLAAKTIGSNEIEDMKIYYKNSRGTWIDPITNKTLSSNNLPEVFFVEHVNLETTAYNYNIEYQLNGGTAVALPTVASSDESFIVSKPTKPFTINIDANSQGANVTMTNLAVVSVSGEQEFAGWTAENINPETAKYKEAASGTPDISWNGITKVGMNSNVTSFVNLRSSQGIVTLVANWAGEILLPTVEKPGYECVLNTNAQGFGESYASGGTYTPTGTESSTTLYVRCTSKMLLSSPFLGIEKDNFESIETVNNKTVPANAIDSWDVSEAQNESIMAWYLDEDEDNKYELYIGQNGGVIANTYSASLFADFTYLDSLILTHFDTSNVTNMSRMFFSAGSNSSMFELNLGDKFDTSNVTNMYNMFDSTGYNSTIFTLDLGDHFDTSKVTNMSSMFSATGYHSLALTLDLEDQFDTSSVTDMSWMFLNTGYSSPVFTLDLGDYFDTSSVTNMSYMFAYTGGSSTIFTLDLGEYFDTSNVTDMTNMFIRTGYISPVFTLDLGDRFDTSNVTDMSSMFESVGEVNTGFTLDLGDYFDTSSVTNMYRMFYSTGSNSNAFTLDLGDHFDTSSVTNMSYMFAYTGHNNANFTLNIGDQFDTSNVTNMKGMFRATGYSSTSFTLDLGDYFDTSNVTNMLSMFDETGRNSTSFTLDLGDNFDTSSVTTMASMFYRTGYSDSSFTLDLGNQFDTSNVVDMDYMFGQTGHSNTTFEIDLSSFDFDSVTNYTDIFNGWVTTNTIWVKNAADQNWIITNSDNENLTTSNVLIK